MAEAAAFGDVVIPTLAVNIHATVSLTIDVRGTFRLAVRNYVLKATLHARLKQRYTVYVFRWLHVGCPDPSCALFMETAMMYCSFVTKTSFPGCRLNHR